MKPLATDTPPDATVDPVSVAFTVEPSFTVKTACRVPPSGSVAVVFNVGVAEFTQFPTDGEMVGVCPLSG